jgi:nucleotidyltransferase substrate binding protein (TIGR01987 family)
MDKLAEKYENFTNALATLKSAITIFELYITEQRNYNPHLTYQEEYRGLRDSVIQRFEYNIDLFWKYLKLYLEINAPLSSSKIPGDIVREACAQDFITTEEAESILAMIKKRNLTSHIYVEEVAEEIAHHIPQFYKTLSTVSEKLKPR